MERMKVLSAALALGEFTVEQVAALSGVNSKTVRSVLDRNPDVVQRVGSTSLGRRGRPLTRWATTGSDATRQILDELEALPSAPTPASTLSADQWREAAVSVAAPDGNPFVLRMYAKTAA